MSLFSLLQLPPPTIDGESLPAYLNRTTRAPKPRPDVLDVELAKWRAERDEQETYNRHAMAQTLQRKRDAAAAVRYSDNPVRNAEQRFHQVRKWDRLQQQLNGDTNGE